ncbi:PHP domain-containing protein [Luteimicrobium subarcticum]|uniref:Polymerase/histidinol phosphatase N-terminal domain-containing protein n=1 Tax=Luteimicrobium subarcticum TaxID=620910 RepID=A0A2M8WV02_9MICO|nr:PHP domain-containing protein [Luteimicrobium subarcticum]PJI94760.1 hypothetical protein CLV34_0607 [Luteimicrobium subarcticum]
MRIDLHTHSTASDGTDDPGQVVAYAAAAGLDVVALTDHDTAQGWPQASSAAREHGVTFVPGAELSGHVMVRGEDDRDHRVPVHLLSYLHDGDDPALVAELERVRVDRRERARTIIGRLAADYPLTWDDVVARTAPGTTVGRPHLADALVHTGIVANREEAFATLLHPSSPYYVGHYSPHVTDLLALVRAAGGVPVIAHPLASVRGRVVDDAAIAAMTEAGLAGVEVDHREHTSSQRAHLHGLAARLGLLTTGSSDYHGDGKPNRLGENTTSPEVLDAIVAAGRGTVVAP